MFKLKVPPGAFWVGEGVTVGETVGGPGVELGVGVYVGGSVTVTTRIIGVTVGGTGVLVGVRVGEAAGVLVGAVVADGVAVAGVGVLVAS